MKACITMNETTFKQLLATYGANPDRWPREYRAEAQAFLDNAEPSTLQIERQLDSLLDTEFQPVDANRVRQQVISQLTPSFTETMTSWLTDGFWRPLAAACLPLFVGILIGGGTAGTTGEELALDEEIALMAMSDADTFNTMGWIDDE